jgi:hypothetical protein
MGTVMSDWKIGDRVRIPTVSFPMRQPHPVNEGKLGYITGTESINLGETFDVPVITLDDGTILKGYECWWEPVKAKGTDVASKEN